MSTEPTDYDADADPEMLANPMSQDGPEIIQGVDGVAAATPVSEDPEGRDDPDADPEMLSSKT